MRKGRSCCKDYTETVALKLTPNMEKELRMQADAKGLPLSTWLRFQMVELFFRGDIDGPFCDD